MTAIRSAMVKASRWSWVTMMVVMPRLTQQDRQLHLHLFPQILVERAQRLVQQQHHRPDGKRPGDSDALLLPAAQLRRVAVL